MTIKASDVIARLTPTLHDIAKVRWPDSEHWQAITDAENAILEARPDLFDVTEDVQFQVFGPKQPVPNDCFMLFDVTHNLNDQKVPVSGITKVERSMMDRVLRDWMAEANDTRVEHWMQDERERDFFWVYPGVGEDPATSQPGWVVMRYARRPVKIVASTDNLTVPDELMNAVYYFAMTRLLEKDEKFAGSPQAKMFLEKFALVVGARTEGEGQEDAASDEREGV